MMKYKVHLLMMSSGERLPVLCTSDGQPLTRPMAYILTELRAQGRSSATLRHALEAIMVLEIALHEHQIDLDARMHEGRYLQLHEVDLIARAANHPVRSPERGPTRQLSRTSAANRIHYILQYLRWQAFAHLMQLDVHEKSYLALRDRVDKACSALKARSPTLSVRTQSDQRQGLSDQALETLQRVVDGVSQVWLNEHAQARNQLMLKWLLELGIRRGELLGVRIDDIDFQKREVQITRQADTKDDPRARQPLAKTHARVLSLSEDLADATQNYVLWCRANQGLSRHHKYLFVSGGTGRPLSLAGANKLFVALRAAGLNLPDDLTAHVLRHTWNDRFSTEMERAGVNPELERKMRSELMGWSPTSESAATYTRRYVRQRAGEAMKRMQGRLKIGGGNS
jgi:integrase